MAEELRMVRRLDELGRIILPIETRRGLGWRYKDELEVIQSLELGEIRLRLKRKGGDIQCALCREDSIDETTAYADEKTHIAICCDCVEKIKK